MLMPWLASTEFFGEYARHVVVDVDKAVRIFQCGQHQVGEVDALAGAS